MLDRGEGYEKIGDNLQIQDHFYPQTVLKLPSFLGLRPEFISIISPIILDNIKCHLLPEVSI